MRYLYKGVILTEDNLARRQWQEDRRCCFCSSNESIQHLLFDCHYAKFMWRIIQVSFNLIPPTSVHNLFTDWLDGVNRKLKSQILVDASAICWAICRLSLGDLLGQVLVPTIEGGGSSFDEDEI